MRGPVILVTILILATNAAQAAAPAKHPVSWYVDHPAERQSVLRMCDNDHALDGSGDCRNATTAAAKTVPGTSTDAFAANEDPAFYRANGPERAMVLAACGTNRPPPASWCQAARAAQSGQP